MSAYIATEHDINDWIAEQMVAVPSIVCCEPEFHKGGMLSKSYIDFCVKITHSSGEISSIRHRFSEFETLRKSLSAKYLKYGIVIPPLPPKTTFSTNSSTNIESPFLKERIQGLTLFCKYIVANLFLANDNDWLSFISEDKKEGENEGEKMIDAMFQYVEQPFKFTISSRMDSIREEVASVEGYSRQALAMARKVQEAERNLHLSFQGLNDTLGAWSNAEVASVKCLNGFPFDATESIISTQRSVKYTMNQLSDMEFSKYGPKEQLGNYLGLFLICMLQFENSLMNEGFKESIKFHDDLVGHTTKMGTQIEKAVAAPDKRHKVEEYTSKLNEIQQQTENYYKGMIYFTLPVMARLRAESYRDAMTRLSATYLVDANTGYQAILNYFTNMGLNPAKWLDTTSSALEDLYCPGLSKGSNFFGMDTFPREDAFAGPGGFAGLFDAARTGNYAPLTGGGDTTIYKNASAPPLSTTNSVSSASNSVAQVQSTMERASLGEQAATTAVEEAEDDSEFTPDPPFTHRGSVISDTTSAKQGEETYDDGDTLGI